MNFPLHSLPDILLASHRDRGSDLLQGQLKEWHYAVHFVSDGSEALRCLLDRNAPGIALIDASLPGLSGLELAVEVKRQSQRRPPWMMLLCEQAGIETIVSAMDAGVDDVLVKPLDAVDLKLRLGVAERVLTLVGQLDSQTHAARFHATHDSLTGLWNRESLLGMLFPETDRVQRMKTPMTLLLMDIDSFSNLNLDYGYEAGDSILQELANRFRRYLRSYDLIGRYGEDEFLLALPGCTSEQALTLAARMKELILGHPFAAGKDMVPLTASMGIAQSHGRSPLVVLREAERALAEAKMAGRNRVIDYRLDAPRGAQSSQILQLESAGLSAILPAASRR